MDLYESDSPEVADLRGLHLYHFVLSNCSQRVRIALEEKGLEWTSHHMDLPGNEHVSPEYQRINPNGVVPTLVHDGQVVIESNDILEYLDDHFPEPALRPSQPEERASMEMRIREASGIQGSIKALSHELLFRPFRKIGAEDVAFYDEHHANRELVDFMRDYAENAEAWQKRVEVARDAMEDALARLEAVLEGKEWLSGERYGLADISWIVNVHRLTQAQYPLEHRPLLRGWCERALARPAFDRAVISYRP